MSKIIPKEQMSAYQRWELSSFDDPKQNTEELALPSAELIADIKKKAQEEGFAQGLQEGKTQGLYEGRLDAQDEVDILKKIAESFGAEIIKADKAIADDVVLLSLDIAKAMLKKVMKIDSEVILAVVENAIAQLPSLAQPALLLLNQTDKAIVEQHLGNQLRESGWQIKTDDNLTSGGCKVETSTNHVDATVETRWSQITTSLGKVDSWK